MAINVPKSEFVQKLIPRGTDANVINFLLMDLQREKIVIVAADALDIPGGRRNWAAPRGAGADDREAIRGRRARAAAGFGADQDDPLEGRR